MLSKAGKMCTISSCTLYSHIIPAYLHHVDSVLICDMLVIGLCSSWNSCDMVYSMWCLYVVTWVGLKFWPAANVSLSVVTFLL